MNTGGFLYTMTKKYPPLIPWRLSRFSYGMMAPWQSYTITNTELVAEGRGVDGVWERIDLWPYFPYMRGERGIRETLRTFRGQRNQKYAAMADMLKEREAKNGKVYEEIRILWERWPKSVDGYSALRKEPEVETTPILTR